MSFFKKSNGQSTTPRQDMARLMAEFVENGGSREVADEFEEASAIGHRPQGCTRTPTKEYRE